MEWIRWRPQYLLIYVLCCLISNFEVFRLLNSEVFEALSLIKKLKLLIQKTGCMCVFKDTILITTFIEGGKTKKQFLRSWSLKLVKLACIGFIIRRLFLRFQFRWSSDDLLWTVITTYLWDQQPLVVTLSIKRGYHDLFYFQHARWSNSKAAMIWLYNFSSNWPTHVPCL